MRAFTNPDRTVFQMPAGRELSLPSGRQARATAMLLGKNNTPEQVDLAMGHYLMRGEYDWHTDAHPYELHDNSGQLVTTWTPANSLQWDAFNQGLQGIVHETMRHEIVEIAPQQMEIIEQMLADPAAVRACPQLEKLAQSDVEGMISTYAQRRQRLQTPAVEAPAAPVQIAAPQPTLPQPAAAPASVAPLAPLAPLAPVTPSAPPLGALDDLDSFLSSPYAAPTPEAPQAPGGPQRMEGPQTPRLPRPGGDLLRQ